MPVCWSHISLNHGHIKIPEIRRSDVKGAPENDGDWLLQQAEDPDALIVPFRPIEAPDAALAAHFELVLATG
jgi:hypothetical protein